MSRHRKYDIEAIRESIKVPCPHCGERLNGAQYLRLSEPDTFRCLRCGKDFEYSGKQGPPMRTS